MPHTFKTFLQLSAFAQQFCSSVPPLSQSVQATSGNVSTSLLRTSPGRGKISGRFNFGVGTKGVGGEVLGGSQLAVKQGEVDLTEAARSLL